MKQKLLYFFIFLFIFSTQSPAQTIFNLPDSLFTTYWHQRATLFRSLPQTESDIIFLGDSITDGGEWDELFGDSHCKNRGISGDITAGVLKRLDEIVKRKPKKIFLLIGINDLSRNISQDSVLKNIFLIADAVKMYSPATKLYVQSILPVNDSFRKFNGHVDKGDNVRWVNEQLKANEGSYRYTFVNLHKYFANDSGKLDKKYSNDGLHLTGAGYQWWKQLVYSYVYDLQKVPSLIPQPSNLVWKEELVELADFRNIEIETAGPINEAKFLQKELAGKKIFCSLLIDSVNGKSIKLDVLPKLDMPEEGYLLKVSNQQINIKAKSNKGLFHGIETFLQLIRGSFVQSCEISDAPAFQWRGFMTDVGRNYQSLPMLKQMIDVMASYKLNVFHFHCTEDIAWRIAIKQYPQLTASEAMQRNKGLYYTETDIKELINYCKERHIEFVPEIDMPGHSAAFRRAMGVDMQSDSGKAILKNILRELFTTYDFKYLHIGADEVKITDSSFVPQITAYAESFGKKIIGWQPGGNFTKTTIRQLWMDDAGKITGNNNLRYIDSRHLYLNHMDPLEAVNTIFYRKIGNRERGNEFAIGATLCLWPDRAVAKEEDILRMNGVYPAMLAFAERTWKGGGVDNWVANIQNTDSVKKPGFTDFENRLLDHKRQYFSDKPFPYVKQTGMVWQFYGPYDNKGDVSQKFINELYDDMQKKKVSFVANGGTIVLRHWWAPLIKGAIDKPKDSTTWFATTRIWADEAGEKHFWIGFNNISRSPSTDSPPAGWWDEKQSKLWVNGKEIAPPVWQRPGRKGSLEEPLLDEGYEYRAPTMIVLKQGWNDVMIKCPVGALRGKNWSNPVKWMFTFVQAEQ